MMDYFKPLMSWLGEQNKCRQIGWEGCCTSRASPFSLRPETVLRREYNIARNIG
jgi:hypothetical protein